MRIIITGVAGFIGSNLADRLLADGHDIIGIDNLSYGVIEQVPEGVQYHNVDIRDKNSYSLYGGADYVFHLAAKNSIGDCQNDPVETADINITGTVNVFEAAKRAGVKKVIYAESSAMYEGVSQIPTPESETIPHTYYAISKKCGSLFSDAYLRFSGLKYTALRYFNVYGPRQDYRRSMAPVMSAFIISMLHGQRPVIYGTGEKRRDFIHVDDINNFHLLCMEDERSDNKVFNLGSGENFSILELFYKIRNIIGDESIEPEFKQDLPGEAQTTLADITSAKTIGWEPRINIDEGLKGLVEYIKSEIEKGNIKIQSG